MFGWFCWKGGGFHKYMSMCCPSDRRVRVVCFYCKRERS